MQTSYRAEIKALYHVVRTAKAPVCIMCDCKGVVNICNHHLDGTLNMQHERAEQDLWDLIFQAAGTGNSRFIARWMPSHLDESKTEQDKAISEGTVTAEDVKGNTQADVLAKEGAAKHVGVGHLANAASDRRKVTILVQKMLLHVWEDYVEKGNKNMRKNEELDVQEMDDFFDNVHEYDEDFD